MLVCGTSQYETALKVANGIARMGACLWMAKSGAFYSLYQEPDPVALSQKILYQKEAGTVVLAIWVAGKRTV